MFGTCYIYPSCIIFINNSNQQPAPSFLSLWQYNGNQFQSKSRWWLRGIRILVDGILHNSLSCRSKQLFNVTLLKSSYCFAGTWSLDIGLYMSTVWLTQYVTLLEILTLKKRCWEYCVADVLKSKTISISLIICIVLTTLNNLTKPEHLLVSLKWINNLKLVFH